ncbi:hypothetical protein F5X99DRAFT_395855 [Biscogniauxia marginata]|nr:hypothetical protein F5X99DRAFT_395855 [Biscogniauxia marginata]
MSYLSTNFSVKIFRKMYNQAPPAYTHGNPHIGTYQSHQYLQHPSHYPQQTYSPSGFYPISPNMHAATAFPPAPPPELPSHTCREFLFIKYGDAQIVRAANQPSALLTITLPKADLLDDNPGMTVCRGDGRGEQIGAAKFHQWTTSKTDMVLYGQAIRFKKEFVSVTGLRRLRWEESGSDGLTLEANGRPIARYTRQKGMMGGVSGQDLRGFRDSFMRVVAGRTVSRVLEQKGVLGTPAGHVEQVEARLEIFVDGLSREQLEEIIVSGAVERERTRREKKDAQSAKIVGNVFDVAV